MFLRKVGSQDPYGVASQKTQFFIVTAVKTPNLRKQIFVMVLMRTSSTGSDHWYRSHSPRHGSRNSSCRTELEALGSAQRKRSVAQITRISGQ
jgi:hypothetical protein